MRTLGGRQFWADVAFFHDWSIQKNVFTGNYRLLDGADRRHAHGTLEECRRRLDRIREERNLPPMSGRAVVLVHGIVRSSKSFGRISDRLREEGYSVFGFDYPSTRVAISDAAEMLAGALESLEGIEEINFVTHSMGGLVVRAFLAEHEDDRLRRMVMLAPPNTGAHLADRLHGNLLYKAIFGPSGQQLISEAEGFIAALPAPEFEFGIIAAGRGTLNGYNPLIPGDDDGTVAVSSTRLPGAADFITLRGLHSLFMRQEETADCIVRFLREGRFREDGPRHPIARTRREREAERAADAASKSVAAGTAGADE